MYKDCIRNQIIFYLIMLIIKKKVLDCFSGILNSKKFLNAYWSIIECKCIIESQCTHRVMIGAIDMVS